jgi:hypothetical protein
MGRQQQRGMIAPALDPAAQGRRPRGMNNKKDQDNERTTEPPDGWNAMSATSQRFLSAAFPSVGDALDKQPAIQNSCKKGSRYFLTRRKKKGMVWTVPSCRTGFANRLEVVLLALKFRFKALPCVVETWFAGMVVGYGSVSLGHHQTRNC